MNTPDAAASLATMGPLLAGIAGTGALLEAMARAHCRVNLECDPDEPTGLLSAPVAWQLYIAEMAPLLDAVRETEIAGAAA